VVVGFRDTVSFIPDPGIFATEKEASSFCAHNTTKTVAYSYKSVRVGKMTIHRRKDKTHSPWTKELPTRPGWYWWRDKTRKNDSIGSGEPRVCLVRMYGSRLALGNSVIDNKWPRGEWAGPISEPV
jgi:hypothetical protein